MPGRGDIRALDLVDRRGHSRFGRRCSQFGGGRVGAAAWPPGGSGGQSRPARARYTRNGLRPRSPRNRLGALAWRRCSTLLGRFEASGRRRTPSWHPLGPSGWRGSVALAPRRLDGVVAAGRLASGALFRSLSHLFARSGLYSPDRQLRALPGPPGPSWPPMFPCACTWAEDMGMGTSEPARLALPRAGRPSGPPTAGQPASPLG